jgi:hypothetical protein
MRYTLGAWYGVSASRPYVTDEAENTRKEQRLGKVPRTRQGFLPTFPSHWSKKPPIHGCVWSRTRYYDGRMVMHPDALLPVGQNLNNTLGSQKLQLCPLPSRPPDIESAAG